MSINSEALNYWKSAPLEDFRALMLYQKIVQSMEEFIGNLDYLSEQKERSKDAYQHYAWSVSVRDFSILLRDALLAVVKKEQFAKDDELIKEDVLQHIQTIIQGAAKDLLLPLNDSQVASKNQKEWAYQKSPVGAIKRQLEELAKQCKKIYRSIDKIDVIRFNINEYVRDFQLQYSVQTSAIQNYLELISEVKATAKTVAEDMTKKHIESVVEAMGDHVQNIEQILVTESIDIIPYPDKEVLTLPVNTENGQLLYKTINIKTEFARWFSSFIYPRIIGMETKRDHAVEKSLILIRQIQNKIAAVHFAETVNANDLQKEFDAIFKTIEKDILSELIGEEKEVTKLVQDHLSNKLKASKVYASDVLFLPESSSSQIRNLSKDAKKRLTDKLTTYNKKIRTSFNTFLSKYIEVDKTQYSQFIKNKLSLDEEDDSLALFLKDGYLGKSFTVPRPDLIQSILEDYQLWTEGFTGAILLSGKTGSGKSSLLGMLNHIGLNEQIIQLSIGESYFINHRPYSVEIDLEALIDKIVVQTRMRKIIICIDNLEQWHDEQIDLYDNISKLFYCITKYRDKIFFVITASVFLTKRLSVFRDLEPIFSRQLDIGGMSTNQLREAINLRARVNESDILSENEIESRFGHIIRESKGNPGLAMIEYCRMSHPSYQPNVKSQQFTELIKRYKTLLTYISSYHFCSIKFFSDSLSDIDYKETMKSIDHLIGQKILIRSKKGYISIHPMMVHTIEKVLLKV